MLKKESKVRKIMEGADGRTKRGGRRMDNGKKKGLRLDRNNRK